jgi:RHS repeat-associated protein
VETRWVWDGDVMLHEMARGSTVSWCYEPDTFAPLARVQNATMHHVVRDNLGTPVALYQESGEPVWQFQADIFGQSLPAIGRTETMLCPLRWPGQAEDSDTGLYYNRFRYYDSQLGEYISSDPIGLMGGLATHAYAQDTLVRLDPFGLTECTRPGRSGTAAEGDVPILSQLPGAAGVRIAGRLSPAQMVGLTERHGVEFSLVYRLGLRRAGGGGTYWLYSGTRNSVSVPIGRDVRWIYHTHPEGSSFASRADRGVLELLEAAGSPQRSSQIVPVGGPVTRFP